MKRPSAAAAILMALVAPGLTLSLGCRSSAERHAEEARAREWSSLREDKRALDDERHELARLRGTLAASPIEADGTVVGAEALALAAEVAAREQRARARSAAIEERLVRHADALARGAGGSAAGALHEVIRLKSDEDIEVAQEWIDRGGDYRRAIEILETQRAVDAGYPRLEQALDHARQMRFVTPQRLARVRPGMTAVEVRAELGPVNLREVLRRPDERLQAWYYPKAAGGRAGVYFRYDPRRRTYVVYQTEVAAGVAQQQLPPSRVG